MKNKVIDKDAKSLLLILVTILSIGLVVLYSASFIVVYKYPNVDPNYYLVKQFTIILFGLIVMTILSVMDYRIHRRYIHHYYVLILFLLIAVLILPAKNGAKRWFDIKYISFQPSEFSKLFIVMFLAHYMERWKERMHEFIRGFVVPIVFVVIPAFLIFLEPDLSTSLFILLLSLILLYIGGSRWYYIILTIALGIFLLFLGYKYEFLKDYQIQRLKEFVDLITGKCSNVSWQTVNSISAIKAGGFIGVGLGLGNLKYYLPIQISDFIFAVLGEEMGMIGMGLILLLYVLMIRQMLKCAFRSVKDGFGRLFIIGYAFWMLLQVTMNVSVVVGFIPITGLTLPFFSQGGSSIMAFLSGYGIVLSVLTHR